MQAISENSMVSVVLPVHNGAATLARAAASILAQAGVAFELVVVNDGSTDATAAVLARLAAADARVRVVRHSVCRGIVAALNTGLAAARGTMIARMDADDVAYPDRLRRQAEYLVTHAEIGLVGCCVRFAGNRAARAGYAAHVDWTNTLITSAEIARNRFVESPFAHPSVMFRRRLVERFGGYADGPFPEDYELWLRWLDAGVGMAKLPETLLDWSDSPARLSRTDPRYALRAFYACKARYLARWLARHNPLHPDIVVWGAGRETRQRAEVLAKHGIRITAYVDIDPRKLGKVVHGRPVLHEDELPAPGRCFVVPYVGRRGAREDIRGRLFVRGFREERDFIMAA